MTASTAAIYVYDLGLDYFSKYRARLAAVTTEQAKAAAEKYLVPETARRRRRRSLEDRRRAREAEARIARSEECADGAPAPVTRHNSPIRFASSIAPSSVVNVPSSCCSYTAFRISPTRGPGLHAERQQMTAEQDRGRRAMFDAQRRARVEKPVHRVAVEDARARGRGSPTSRAAPAARGRLSARAAGTRRRRPRRAP